MIQPEIAKALRVIDTQAAEARRELNGGDSQTVRGYLFAIQQTAQTALQELREKHDEQKGTASRRRSTDQAGA